MVPGAHGELQGAPGGTGRWRAAAQPVREGDEVSPAGRRGAEVDRPAEGGDVSPSLYRGAHHGNTDKGVRDGQAGGPRRVGLLRPWAGGAGVVGGPNGQ